MNIPIHGGFHARMAEKFLQYLGLDTALNGTGSVSVAQSMRTEPLDLGLMAQYLLQVGYYADLRTPFLSAGKASS